MFFERQFPYIFLCCIISNTYGKRKITGEHRMKHETGKNKKIRTELILSCCLFLLAFLAKTAAGRSSAFANWYSHRIYRFFSFLFTFADGHIPFSITEIGLYCLLLFILSDFIRSLLKRKPLFFFLHLLLIGSVLFFLYIFNCGINYHRSSFSQESGFTVQAHSEEDLKNLCTYLVKEINTAEAGLSVEGSPVIGQDESMEKPDFAYLLQAGRTGSLAMQKLGGSYPGLSGSYPYPKPLLISRILSVQQLTGVYSPFTIEANYNREIAYYDIPFTICHELSHLKGYMQEEEANFISFLACTGSDDLYYRYSGLVSGWVYAGNALAAADPDAFAALYGSLNENTKKDLSYNNRFWKRFEGKIAETSDQVNDHYLKMNGQTEGVKSYGHVVDLMLTWYSRETAG